MRLLSTVATQLHTTAKRFVLCCGYVGLSFLAIVGFSHLQKVQAADHAQPNHQVSAVPTKSQPQQGVDYGKLPLSFEANQGQTSAPVKFLARPWLRFVPHRGRSGFEAGKGKSKGKRQSAKGKRPSGCSADLQVGKCRCSAAPALRCCGSSRSCVLTNAGERIGKRSGKAAGPESGSRATIFFPSLGGQR
jgi:hypothetical protein